MNHIKTLDNVSISQGICEYWDIRIEETIKTEIIYQDYELTSCSNKPSLGAFVRVFDNGMWFYSSTTDLNNLEREIESLAKQSKSLKRDSENLLKPYNQIPSTDRIIKSEGSRLDKVSIETKKSTCEAYFEIIRAFENLKGVKVSYSDEYKIKHFRSSKDVQFSYDFNQCGISVSYTVFDGNNQFEDRVNFYGKEIDNLNNLSNNITSAINESFLFTDAKPIDAGNYPVVMDSEVVGVFAHESFGHKSEADFMLGDEEAKETWKIGKKVGNECLSIVDSGEEYGTSGYCPIDDEGFKTQKTYLIKDGVLTGRLHSQYTSQVLDEAPTGNGRAMNFEFEPIVRMTNTYVEPGQLSFEDLISKVELGIYAKDINHGSGLSTFTIAPRKCYMIRNGKLAEPVRVSVMSGTVFEALNNIEGCSKNFNMINTAFGGCGKMEQWPLPVSFGGSKVLVSKMVIS